MIGTPHYNQLQALQGNNMGTMLADPSSSPFMKGMAFLLPHTMANVTGALNAFQQLKSNNLDLMQKKSEMQRFADLGLGADPNTGITWNQSQTPGLEGGNNLASPKSWTAPIPVPPGAQSLPPLPGAPVGQSDTLGVPGGVAGVSLPAPPASSGASSANSPPPIPNSISGQGGLGGIIDGLPPAVRAAIAANHGLLSTILSPKMVPIVDGDGNPKGQVPEYMLPYQPVGTQAADPRRLADPTTEDTHTVQVPGPDGRMITLAYNSATRKYDTPIGGPGAPSDGPMSDIGKLQHDAALGGRIPATIPAPPPRLSASTALPPIPGNSANGTPQIGPKPINPFAQAIDNATKPAGQIEAEKNAATDNAKFGEDIGLKGREADAALPDMQMLRNARRIFNRSGQFGEEANQIYGAAQSMGLGDLVDQAKSGDSVRAKAAAGQIVQKMTTMGGFSDKPDAIQRLTQQEVQAITRAYPGAINQSDDAATIMMNVKIAQLQQAQKMRDALEGARDSKTGALPGDVKARLLPFTQSNNAQIDALVDKLMGKTFGPNAQSGAPDKPVPANAPNGSKWGLDKDGKPGLFAPLGVDPNTGRMKYGQVNGY